MGYKNDLEKKRHYDREWQRRNRQKIKERARIRAEQARLRRALRFSEDWTPMSLRIPVYVPDPQDQEDRKLRLLHPGERLWFPAGVTYLLERIGLATYTGGAMESVGARVIAELPADLIRDSDEEPEEPTERTAAGY